MIHAKRYWDIGGIRSINEYAGEHGRKKPVFTVVVRHDDGMVVSLDETDLDKAMGMAEEIAVRALYEHDCDLNAIAVFDDRLCLKKWERDS